MQVVALSDSEAVDPLAGKDDYYSQASIVPLSFDFCVTVVRKIRSVTVVKGWLRPI